MDFNAGLPPPGMMGAPMHPGMPGMMDMAAAMYPQQPAEFGLMKSAIMDGAQHFQPSALVFDPEEELLWSGNNGVSVEGFN